MCNGKHFLKLDITNYDNGIELSSTDIAKLKKNVKLDSKITLIIKLHNFITKCNCFTHLNLKYFRYPSITFFFRR